MLTLVLGANASFAATDRVKTDVGGGRNDTTRTDHVKPFLVNNGGTHYEDHEEEGEEEEERRGLLRGGMPDDPGYDEDAHHPPSCNPSDRLVRVRGCCRAVYEGLVVLATAALLGGAGCGIRFGTGVRVTVTVTVRVRVRVMVMVMVRVRVRVRVLSL
jgi:hypothetical protein